MRRKRPEREAAEADDLLGSLAADWMIRRAGTWRCVLVTVLGIAGWIAWNDWTPWPWDKAPYFYLNLLMSTAATLTTPILLIADNRRWQKHDEKMERIIGLLSHHGAGSLASRPRKE